jgi:hypothetical protein
VFQAHLLIGGKPSPFKSSGKKPKALMSMTFLITAQPSSRPQESPLRGLYLAQQRSHISLVLPLTELRMSFTVNFADQGRVRESCRWCLQRLHYAQHVSSSPVWRVRPVTAKQHGCRLQVTAVFTEISSDPTGAIPEGRIRGLNASNIALSP